MPMQCVCKKRKMRMLLRCRFGQVSNQRAWPLKDRKHLLEPLRLTNSYPLLAERRLTSVAMTLRTLSTTQEIPTS